MERKAGMPKDSDKQKKTPVTTPRLAAQHPDALGEKRQATQLRIVKGGARAFAQHGVDGTTVSHILKEAGVSRRTFYQFFPDKIALLLMIYERSTKHLVDRRKEVMALPGSGLERLQRGEQVFLDMAAEAGQLVRVLASEAMRPDGSLMARRMWVHQAVEDLYCETYLAAEGHALDPLRVRGLVLYTEALILHVLLHGYGGKSGLQKAQTLVADHLLQVIAHASPKA